MVKSEIRDCCRVPVVRGDFAEAKRRQVVAMQRMWEVRNERK